MALEDRGTPRHGDVEEPKSTSGDQVHRSLSDMAAVLVNGAAELLQYRDACAQAASVRNTIRSDALTHAERALRRELDRVHQVLCGLSEKRLERVKLRWDTGNLSCRCGRAAWKKRRAKE